MSRPPVRVLVVGAGPAGLAAAERLVDRGAGRCRVRLANLGHHVGGKAASWRDAAGRLIDHGLHITPGFYVEMKALLARAGVDVAARLVSNEGRSYVYEKRDGQVHELAVKRNPVQELFASAAYSGFSVTEKAQMTRFVLANLGAFAGTQPIEQFDDVCFTTWCLENGLPPAVVRTNAMAIARVGQMSWPGEISAYSLLKTLRVMARDYRTSEYGFCDGGMSERFWEPILRRIATLGGEYEMMRQLTRIHHDGTKVTAVTFAEPSPAGHDDPARPAGRATFEGPVPSKAGSDAVDSDFDFVVSAIPPDSFKALNAGDARFWSIPEFAALRQLRTVAPLAMQLWLRAPVDRPRGLITGLEGPLPILLDVKHVVREYRFNPAYGSVLYLAGQETGCEDWSDERHLDQVLENLSKLPGFEAVCREGRAGLLHYQLVRHRGAHERYLRVEPGSLRFRPPMRTRLGNLFLAGDWVRSELDFPCMEAAVRSGLAAADAVLDLV